MQHDLVRVSRRIVLIALAPVIANRVRKDRAVLVECRCCDAAPNFGVALETVLGVLVPEMEGSVGTGGAEGAVDRVEGDVVDGVTFGDLVGGRVAVALEGEVGAADTQSQLVCLFAKGWWEKLTWNLCPQHTESHSAPRYYQWRTQSSPQNN